MSEKDFKKKLSADEYHVLREGGTEYPFTGKYNEHSEIGTYYCKACGTELFSSDGKFDSSCGWPAFFEGKNLEYKEDRSHGMVRKEVLCSCCGSHLGHWFPDGPRKSRYCINSVCLDFKDA